MKKRGSSLVITLTVTSLLLILSFALISEVMGAYRFTIRNEQKQKLTLMAESGIEKAIVMIKDKIYNTPDLFTNSSRNFNPDKDISFTDGNIIVSVTYSGDIGVGTGATTYGVPGGVLYVKIVSEAKDSVFNEAKKITAIIRKDHISNAYYQAMFNNVITTLDEIKGNGQTSFTMQNVGNNLELDGNMYLQGGVVNIRPYDLNYTSGTVSVNANSLIKTANMNSYTTNNRNQNYLPILTVERSTAVGGTTGIKDFYSGSRYTNDNDEYKVLASTVNSSTGATLAMFKIVPKNSTGTTAVFDWSLFVDDVKDYIMRNMIKIDTNGDGTLESYTGIGTDYGTAFNNAYRGMYKLYLIGGNASITTPKANRETHNLGTYYINHVIYVEGKCTIKKGDSRYPGNTTQQDIGYIWLDNSSIMAKQVEIEDLPGGPTESGPYANYIWARLIGIKPIGTAGGTGSLSPFSAANRALINGFCTKHINGYASAFKFKIYKWIEE